MKIPVSHEPTLRAAASMARQTVVWLLSIGLVLSGTGVPTVVHAQATDELRSELDAAFEQLDRILERAERDLDPTRADLDELTFELAFEEPASIVSWVATEIAFEPYVGLLRGPEGTLAAAAGNALDQSVLLARLLNDAGFEADVARATIDAESAGALVDTLARGTALAGVRGASESDRPDAAELADLLGFDADELERLRTETEADLVDMTMRAEDVARELRDRVRAAGIDLAGADMRARLVEEARDYFFVRWRTSGDDAWTHAHPVFTEPPAAVEAVAIEETLAGTVPVELQHRVRIQLFVEQKLGDSLEVKPITDVWERPTANLVRQPLRISSLADGFSEVDDVNDLDAARDATRFFMPRFADRPAPGAMAFDLDGHVLPASVAADQAAGLFQEVGGAVGSAAGALAGMGGDADDADPEDYVTLSGQWIEYTVIAPGGDETVHRRMIVDRIGPDARAEGRAELRPMDEADVFAAVQESHVVMVSVGGMTEAYATWHTVRAQRRANELMRGVVASVLRGDPAPAASSDLAQVEATVGYLLLHGMYDAYQPDGAIRVQTGPLITVLSRSIDGSTARSDVVTGAERVIGPDAAVRVGDAVASGVWRTMVEATPLRNGADRVQDVFASLDAAEAEGIATLVLHPGDTSRVTELAFPEATLAAIRSDLEAGYAVVAPVALPEAVPEPAWWRVDPASGATLGRGGDGRGQTLVEYFSTEISIGVTVAFALYGQHQCDKIEDPGAAGCCMVQNVALAGIGVGIGALLAGAWTALRIMVVMDGAYNVAGAVGVFDVCRFVAEDERWKLELVDA